MKYLTTSALLLFRLAGCGWCLYSSVWVCPLLSTCSSLESRAVWGARPSYPCLVFARSRSIITEHPAGSKGLRKGSAAAGRGGRRRVRAEGSGERLSKRRRTTARRYLSLARLDHLCLAATGHDEGVAKTQQQR